jgi:uroporphyrinogen III methyltransferase/synthase
MPSSRPLDGRTILLTRPEEESAALAARLRSLGARVEIEPVLAFESLASTGEALAAARNVASYEVLMFTSANGVRFFLEALGLAGRVPADVTGKIGAVGPGTAKALGEAGLAVGVVAADSRAEGLVEALGAEVSPGARVLWARAESARDVLPRKLREAGATIDEVRLYRTVASPLAARAAAALARAEVDAVVFASPSALRHLLDGAGAGRRATEEGLRRVRRVAIGSVTAAALLSAGFPPAAVASSPTDEGLESAILRSFAD